MVETPVLFITFVRPDYARQTWEGIKAAQPKTLYFYSNKGRAEKKGEVERNNEIRAYINEIDWDCDLHTWFRDECVNVYDSLRGAITWLFDNEEQGIILEEDCVPTKAFFSFCDQMIEKFKNEKKVWYVSGDNFYNLNPSGYDYIFSRYYWLYGWASWRDRWQSIDWKCQSADRIIKEKVYNQLYKTKRQGRNRKFQIINTVDMVKQTKCWDYAFGYTIDQNLGFGVFPTHQLIHNIGLAGQHHGVAQATFVNVEPSYPGDEYIVKSNYPIVEYDKEFDFCYYKLRISQEPKIIRLKKEVKNLIWSLSLFFHIKPIQ